MFIVSIFIVWLLYLLIDKWFRSLKVDKLSTKYVFISGCDSGFGRELAIRLDGLGLHVFAGCLTEDGKKSLSSVCSSRLDPVSLDVTKEDSIAAALLHIKNTLPSNIGLWALVNNAGIIGNFSSFELCNREDFIKVLNVDLLGPAEMTKQFLPLIRKSKGRIVNMTSSFGRLPAKGAPYCAAKFGLEAVSDILRRELYSQGIKVSIIEPGGFATSVGNNLKNEMVSAMEKASPDVKQIYERSTNKWITMLSNPNTSAPTLLEPVIDAYTHAIVSRYPRSRYVVGIDARFAFIPISYLPTWISDWIMRILSKLNLFPGL